MSVARILDMKGHLVFSVGDNAPISSVVDALATHGVGVVVVTNSSHQPVGIISERDVIRSLARDVNVLKKKASEVMTHHVVTCAPGESRETVSERMAREGVRHLPVEQAGKMIGLISARDILAQDAENHQPSGTGA